jgi:hypothetical protein
MRKSNDKHMKRLQQALIDRKSDPLKEYSDKEAMTSAKINAGNLRQ